MPELVELKSNHQFIEDKKNFIKRWQTDLMSEGFSEFKTRVYNVLGVYGDIPIKTIEIHILHLFGIDCIFEEQFDFNFDKRYFNRSRLKHKVLDMASTEIDFIWRLETIINNIVGIDSPSIDARSISYNIVSNLATAIELSNIQVRLCQYGNKFEFHPKGAELLDEKLVNDNLNWLEDYPEARGKFHEALIMSLKKDNPRSIIDNMRLALELFLRAFLVSDKSLENQKSVIGQYFKDCGTPVEISNMYSTLLSQYAKYQNEHIKHGDTCSENEVEFMIYLTGAFIRFLIQTKNVEVAANN